MATKGRYGRYLRILVVLGDFICINLAYLLSCRIFNFDDGFYNPTICSLINIAYLPIAFVFSQIHNQRIVYANHTVKTALEATVSHAILFLALLYFFTEISETKAQYILSFYAIFVFFLPAW